MGFPFDLALRYMGSKKRSFISMGTFFAIFGVALGVCGLATAMSVTGGFRQQFRDKVLGVNAHVIILKRSSYFGDYRELMADVGKMPEVVGVAPFTINPMMVTRGDRTATGVLLKGVEPDLVGKVLDLPQHMVEGSLKGLRIPGAAPPEPRALRSAPDTPNWGMGGAGATDGFRDVVRDLIDQEAKEALKERGQGGGPGSLAPDDAFPDDTGPSFDEILAEAEKKAAEEAALAPVIQKTDEEQALIDSGLADLPEDAPVGEIAPEGGYTSLLPADDVLPEALNPDPCAGDKSSLPGIVIGRTLGENLKAGIGDCVQVTSPTIGFSFSRGEIRAPIAKQFRVIGIFYAGFDQYDAKLVYTDLYQAQQFYDAGDSVTGVELKVSDIDSARSVARKIDDNLGKGLHYTMDWEELNHGLFTALRIQQILMSLVLALIIEVAAFTVIATLIMVVLDKKKEIAVMKAMGATDNAILRAFLYQGGIIGVVGGGLGLGLAIVVCKLLLTYAIPLDPKVYFISRLPVEIQPSALALVFFFAVLVCVGATVWPALYAAKLRPAEAFRDQ